MLWFDRDIRQGSYLHTVLGFHAGIRLLHYWVRSLRGRCKVRKTEKVPMLGFRFLKGYCIHSNKKHYHICTSIFRINIYWTIILKFLFDLCKKKKIIYMSILYTQPRSYENDNGNDQFENLIQKIKRLLFPSDSHAG